METTVDFNGLIASFCCYMEGLDKDAYYIPFFDFAAEYLQSE